MSFFILGYSLNFIIVCHCHFKGGIPPPSRGIVGKNQSAQSKTTVRSKRVFALKVRRGAPSLFPTVLINSNTIELALHTSCYCILDLLCVNYYIPRHSQALNAHCIAYKSYP